jgi:nucleotide-binding universal stress UspA family protein
MPLNLLFESGEHRVESVLLPTDLSQASERAFDHALAIAVRYGCQFTLLHAVGRRSTDNWPEFPSVRGKLAQWRRAGTTAGIEDRIRRSGISKIDVEIRDPVAAAKWYIERNTVDMLVVATEGRGGLARLIRPPLAERLARETQLFTLFIPEGAKRFVDGDTGEVTLRRILIPVDAATDPKPAMLRAVQAAALVDNPELEITLLHVTDGEDAQPAELPYLPYCRWNMVQRSGGVVEEILAVADEIDVDAIYMSTSWNKAGFGRITGGVTEAILSGAPCPVAVVTAG